jgi:hypothetical protein
MIGEKVPCRPYAGREEREEREVEEDEESSANWITN